MESIKDILLRMLKMQRDITAELGDENTIYTRAEVVAELDKLIEKVEDTPEPTHNQIQKNLRQQVGELKSENSALNEKLQNYIPRRRVRRVYKQIKKILEQDGITDDLDIEE